MPLEAQDNPFTYITLVDTADPSTPTAGTKRLWVDTDDTLKIINESAVVTAVGGAAASVATDTIWDAAGDLAVGSGADTAARLAIGNAGGLLARINGAVAWNARTSFPTATTGDRVFRTDLGMEFYYDGTRWLSMQVFTQPMLPNIPATVTTGAGDLQTSIAVTTTNTSRSATPSILGASDIWLVDYKVTFVIVGGTALSGSHKWVGTMAAMGSAGTTLGTLVTTTLDSGALNTWRVLTTAIGAVQTSGTFFFTENWTKTGTPGTLTTGETLSYRIIGV